MNIEEIKQAVAAPLLYDPEALALFPAETGEFFAAAHERLVYLLAAAERQTAELAALKEKFENLNLALSEYANETGSGRMLFDNLQLCLNVVEERKRNQGRV